MHEGPVDVSLQLFGATLTFFRPATEVYLALAASKKFPRLELCQGSFGLAMTVIRGFL